MVTVLQAQHPACNSHISIIFLGFEGDLCNVVSGWLQKIWDCSSAFSFPNVGLCRMGNLPPSASPTASNCVLPNFPDLLKVIKCIQMLWGVVLLACGKGYDLKFCIYPESRVGRNVNVRTKGLDKGEEGKYE